MNRQSGLSACAIVLFSMASIVLPAPLDGSQEPAKQIDPCKLLTSAEVEAVQGEAVLETKKTLGRADHLLMSQCVFKTTTPAKSVSVALAVPNPADSSAVTPRQFWRQQFHSAAATRRKKADKLLKEEGEEGSEAQGVSGLGEEAYWIGNPIIGALYVLHGEKFVRISLGGVRKQSERKKKSIALAAKIVTRLN